VHPDSLEETIERIGALSEPGMASEPSAATLLRADGTRIAAESISVRIEWEGQPAFQVILRDMTERRRAEAAVRFEASLIAHVSDAVIATDLKGLIRSWNRSAESLYGRRAGDVLGRPVADLLGADAVAADGTPRAGEIEHEAADGTRTMLVSVAPVRDELGDPTGTVAVCTDLTERLGRLAAEARYRAAVAALDEGVLVVDRDGGIVSANASARAMLGAWLVEGVHSNELIDRWPLVAKDGTPLATLDHPLAVGLRSGRASSRVVVGIREGDTTRWLSISVRPLTEDEAEQAGALVCSLSEITEHKRIEDQIAFQATHDPLTRLPNRDLVLDALDAELLRAEHDRSCTALLMLDLDRFKTVNDTFGHVVGDEVLQVIAKRIRTAARDVDHLGRLAGDEFVIVCPGLAAPEDSRAVAEAVAAEIRHPVRLASGQTLVVTASIGIACSHGPRSAPEQILAHADLAMYRAKELGRSRVELFDDALRSTVARQLHVHERLRNALEADEITVHYQPVARAATGDIVGVEVLARWNDPDLGPIDPVEFIPVAEDNGLMVVLGAQILRSALRQVVRWQKEVRCPADFMLSVNLSPRQLGDSGFVGTVSEILDETGFDPRQLWFEITESVLIEEASRVSRALSELRGLGIHFAIDDFGTGYSSLALLKRLPLEALKIDRSFVTGLVADPESEAIVAAIIRLSQSLHLRTIAEGVESPDQLARLSELGCELVQGYLFGEPVPPEAIAFKARQGLSVVPGG
ncbi:MAG: putative bifunctional diguanylate cyclase/phosphodiesterase, partial [Acidimicrobiia bacterium]